MPEADLFPGQMVYSPDFTLMDSMAALQIMDPRMDSGMLPIPDHLIAEGDRLPLDSHPLPCFDAEARLSAADVCWIMDRLLACEVSWHKGASLSQTIHTCLYVHSLASIHPRAPTIPGKESNGLVSMVLRPFLLAVLKSVALVWDELSKGNLVDGEDFNGDKAGVSLLEDMHPNEAVSLLQDAASYIKKTQEADYNRPDTLSTLEAESLLSRVELRKVSRASTKLAEDD